MNTRLINFTFIVVTLMSFGFFVYAGSSLEVGKVSRLRSPVTILEIGKRAARELKQGDVVTNGSSILSGEKGFAIISFYNGHQMTVSPSSKVLVAQEKKNDPEVVQLLMGKIRASVRPDLEQKQEKFFIKTRSAAIGVRGTEFQSSFNPSNSVTTLLTFSGKVAMNKVDEKSLPSAGGSFDVIKLKETLSATSAVTAKTGDYAGTAGEKMVAPVKISPVQLTLLKMSKEEEEKKEIPKEELEKEIAKTKDEYAKIVTEKEDKKEETKASDIRSGGLVDLATGFYIPPTEKSEFDKVTNVFVQKGDIGTLKGDGSYVPPIGLKIDALKGFVVDEEKKGKDSSELAQKLNGEIKKQILPVHIKSKLEDEISNPYEKYYRHE